MSRGVPKMNEVIFSKNDNGLGIITLNRPATLNALTYNMITSIHKKLIEWENDKDVSLVMLEGAGDRAFCAGGDIKAIYEARQNPSLNGTIKQFFEAEYKLDLYIYNYSKPIIANMDGIVMGGGVGLANGASHRIITEDTRWAMPEMTIGFFTDVGAAYFFNKAPGYIGRYLALTANSITGKDVIYIKAADALIPSVKTEEFYNKIHNTNWLVDNVSDTLNDLINQFDKQNEYEAEFENYLEQINNHFKYETVEQIIKSLESENDNFTNETKELMLSKSPFSLKLTLKQQIDCANKTIEQCLAIDTVIANNFMNHDDFYEGIRSVLIDRDNNPKYTYKTLSDVTADDVKAFFK